MLTTINGFIVKTTVSSKPIITMETSKNNMIVVEIHTIMISTNLSELMASMPVCDFKIQALQPLFRGEAICQGTMPINSPLHTELISNNPSNLHQTGHIDAAPGEHARYHQHHFYSHRSYQRRPVEMNNYSPFSLILDTAQSANDRVRRPAEMVAILERFFFPNVLNVSWKI